MKAGRSLTELAQELTRQVESKKDYLADSRNLAVSEDGRLVLSGRKETYGMSDLCHRQVASRLGIPQKYYDLMREQAPALLAQNANHWLQKNPEKRLIRTLDGNARAFLSDRYRPLDNYDLAQAVLPQIANMGCKVESAELTETRLYIKVVTDRIQTEIRKGDVVQAGLVISNSEVGCGSVRVEPLVYRLVCLNGMVAADYAMRKYHVGRGAGDLESEAVEFYKDSTRELSDRAFWAKVRDTVEATMTQSKFEMVVNRMRESTEKQLLGDPVKAVELTSKHFGFGEEEQGGVLRHLIKGGDLTQYGLMNAVTRMSQDVASYDRATELERIGGEVLELPKREWELISKAV